ncbi:uncharacterized protein isoform X2 [Musca autumnalis]
MEAFTIFCIYFWFLFFLIFGPMVFFICIHLPEVSVQYIKKLRF